MDRRVARIVHILETEWQQRLQVNELARRVQLCTSHLEHLFKSNVNLSITEFILNKRLDAAAERIAATDERISIICYNVGFTDHSNFDHAFKRRFGMSPREFRLRRANQTNTS
jgi:transcriptional regulator GlxA family with amidase domain